MNENRAIETRKVNVFLKERIYPGFKKLFDSTANEKSFELYNKRMDKGLSFRPYYMKAMYKYIVNCMVAEQIDKGEDIERKYRKLGGEILPFVAETIIIIQYHNNHIFDKKNGVSPNIDYRPIQDSLINADAINNRLYEYFVGLIQKEVVTCKQVCLITNYVGKIMDYVNEGQRLELDFNRLQNIKENTPVFKVPFKSNFSKAIEIFVPFKSSDTVIQFLYKQFDSSLHNYLENYLKRMCLTTGTLYSLMVELLMKLMNYNGVEYNNIQNFTLRYGLMRQLINDNCDIVPSYKNLTTNAKVKQDAFSDLRNQNITLPLLFHYVNGEGSFLNKCLDEKQDQLSEKEESIIFDEIRASGAVFKSMSIARLLGKNALSKLKSEYCTINQNEDIRDIFSIMNINKFYYEIYKKNNNQGKNKNKTGLTSKFYRLTALEAVNIGENKTKNGVPMGVIV